MANGENTKAILSSIEHSFIQAALDLLQQSLRRQLTKETNAQIRDLRQDDMNRINMLRDKLRAGQ